MHHFGTIPSPLDPISAADLLTVELSLEVRCDPLFSDVPEGIHLAGEVFSEWA